MPNQTFSTKMDVDKADEEEGVESMEIDVDMKRENLKRQRDCSTSFESNTLPSQSNGKAGESGKNSVPKKTREILKQLVDICTVNISSDDGEKLDAGFDVDVKLLPGMYKNIVEMAMQKNVVQYVIMDVISTLMGNEDFDKSLEFFKKLTSKKASIASVASLSAFSKKKLDSNTPEFNFIEQRNRFVLSVAYLIDCLDRWAQSPASVKFSSEVTAPLFEVMRVQLVDHIALVMVTSNYDPAVYNFILQMNYHQRVPPNLLSDLVSNYFTNHVTDSYDQFKKLVEPLLFNLYMDMQSYASLVYDNHYRQPLATLASLCFIAVRHNNTTVYPIPDMVSVDIWCLSSSNVFSF